MEEAADFALVGVEVDSEVEAVGGFAGVEMAALSTLSAMAAELLQLLHHQQQGVDLLWDQQPLPLSLPLSLPLPMLALSPLPALPIFKFKGVLLPLFPLLPLDSTLELESCLRVRVLPCGAWNRKAA